MAQSKPLMVLLQKVRQEHQTLVEKQKRQEKSAANLCRLIQDKAQTIDLLEQESQSQESKK